MRRLFFSPFLPPRNRDERIHRLIFLSEPAAALVSFFFGHLRRRWCRADAVNYFCTCWLDGAFRKHSRRGGIFHHFYIGGIDRWWFLRVGNYRYVGSRVCRWPTARGVLIRGGRFSYSGAFRFARARAPLIPIGTR